MRTITRRREDWRVVLEELATARDWLLELDRDEATTLAAELSWLAEDAARAEAWFASWEAMSAQAAELAASLIDGLPLEPATGCCVCDDGIWDEEAREVARAALEAGDALDSLVGARVAEAADEPTPDWLTRETHPVAVRLAERLPVARALIRAFDPVLIWERAASWYDRLHEGLLGAAALASESEPGGYLEELREELDAFDEELGERGFSIDFMPVDAQETSVVDEELCLAYRELAGMLRARMRSSYLERYVDPVVDVLARLRPSASTPRDRDRIRHLLAPRRCRRAIDARSGGRPSPSLLALGLDEDDRVGSLRWALPHVAGMGERDREASVAALRRLGFRQLSVDAAVAMRARVDGPQFAAEATALLPERMRGRL